MIMIEALDGKPLGVAAEISPAGLIPEQRGQLVINIQTAYKEIFDGAADDLLRSDIAWGSDRLDPATIARIVEADGLSAYGEMGQPDSAERRSDASYAPALGYVRLDPEKAETILADIPADRKLHLGGDHWLTMDGPVPATAIAKDRWHLRQRLEARVRDYARAVLQQGAEPTDAGRPDSADHETKPQHADAIGRKAMLGSVIVLPNLPPRV